MATFLQCNNCPIVHRNNILRGDYKPLILAKFVPQRRQGNSLLLPPATKLRQGNVFTPVCDSVRGGGLCPGVSVQWGSLSSGGLCPVGSLSSGVSVQWGSLSRGSPSGGISVPRGVSIQGGWGSLSRLVSVHGSLCQGGLCQGDPRIQQCILMECILVVELFSCQRLTSLASLCYFDSEAFKLKTVTQIGRR